jgi:hypothetical protein
MNVVSHEYGTLVIGICLSFNFVVVFSFNVFQFPPKTDKLLGDFYVIRRFIVFFILKSNFHWVKRNSVA